MTRFKSLWTGMTQHRKFVDPDCTLLFINHACNRINCKNMGYEVLSIQHLVGVIWKLNSVRTSIKSWVDDQRLLLRSENDKSESSIVNPNLKRN
jgi:hypothetical protein